MSREEFIMPDERLLPEFTADGHLEEGTVHAWLDDAFDVDATALVAAHVGGCASCAALVAEARGLMAGSSRILAALDVTPAGVVPAADAARTAARIADAVPEVAPDVPRNVVPLNARARNAGARRNIRPWWYSAAAAAVLVLGLGSTVWLRGGKELANDTTEGASAQAAKKAEEPAVAAAAPASAEARSAAPSAAPPVASSKSPTVEPLVLPTPAPAASAPSPAAAVTRDLAARRDAPRDEPRNERRAAAVAEATPAAPPPVVAPAAAPAPAAAMARAPLAMSSATAVPVADAGATEAAPRRVVVTGTVVDASTAQALRAQVQITATQGGGRAPLTQSTTTDLLGRFSVTFDRLAPSTVLNIRTYSIGYEIARTQHTVQSDTVRVTVRLPRATMTLSGVVTNSASEPSSQEKARLSATVTTAAPPVAPSATAPSPAYGVAGGVARGVEMIAPRRRAAADAATNTTDAAHPPRPYPGQPGNREQYDRIEDNPFLGVGNNPLSTFSIDVDRASYGNVRRFLQRGQRPPADAVRIEELINYFPYELREPRGNDPVAITTEVTAAPWQPRHQLVRIALQSKRIQTEALPPNNLVFLIDVSGSMMSPDKLPLVKSSLQLLVNQLRPQDRVAIVTYAGAAGLVLPSTSGDEKERIMQAIDRLEAGGSTAGGAGIELAYRTAREHFMEHGNNRVILATDGDFNVGVSSDGELERLIERRRTEGTYLTILGFGTGNYQDAKMEKLAKRGNGNYAYVDGIDEARKMLVREMGATLLTVANDVKLQIEFNPRRVQAYRLIGYEDRLLRNEDFTDDRKDAGDLGAGHQVTALYEIVPVGVSGTISLSEPESRRYEPLEGAPRGSANDGELLFVNLRYKRPGESASRLLTQAVKAQTGRGSADMRFASSVAAFGMLLRDSPYKGNTSAAQVLEQARAALGEDEGGYRAEFVRLVERYRDLGVRAGERR